MADGVVRPEVEVELVAWRDVAGGSLLATEPSHERSLGFPALPHLQHVVLTAGVRLQLKVKKLYLDPVLTNKIKISNFHKSYFIVQKLKLNKKSPVEICTENVKDELRLLSSFEVKTKIHLHNSIKDIC